ncbi:MAG: nucleotidyl transferase AbiEii/AbiGii toxin family protein [Nanoarchaeota archaeon]
MQRIPLSLRLKRESHRRIAQAQDLIVREVMKHAEEAVMHGGTAIWRCYDGKRFSEDVNYYLERNLDRINAIFLSLQDAGFSIVKKKITGRGIFSELVLDRTAVRFEATFQKKKGILADYETADGNFVTIHALSPESFIREKVDAYLHRKKIRDLWDVFFLLKSVRDVAAVKKDVERLLQSCSPPVDESDLKAIIIEGITPSSKEMLEYIRTWESKSIRKG